MDLKQIKADVKQWAASVTAMPCAWRNDPQTMQIKAPARIELDGPHSIVGVGQDWLQHTQVLDEDDEPTGQLVPTVVGNREFTVTIRAVSRSQDGNESGEFFCEKLRTSLKLTSVQEHFRASEIAVVRCGKSQPFDAPFDGRWEAISAMELRLAAAISQSDISVGQIAAVGVSSLLQDSAGQLLPEPPNYTDEIVEIEE
jgi:hypothetical protein